MKVHLNYFKPNGKHYASGEYDTAVPVVELHHPPGRSAPPLYRIFEEVAGLKAAKRLPGLREGHSEFIVLIDVPEHPHRHLHLLPCERIDLDHDETLAIAAGLDVLAIHGASKAADVIKSRLAGHPRSDDD